MNKIPANPKIYHITHINNLPKIVEAGCLWSDRQRLQQEFNCDLIGMPTIKSRRLNNIDVSCNTGTKVGDYVPFYFCPRSIMLFIFHKKNHPDLPYRGGQEPIVHLQADMGKCAKWATESSRPIAFSTSNAGSFTADFYKRRADLEKIDWQAVNTHDFQGREVQERKQAEFLIFKTFPWSLVEHIGVFDQNTEVLARQAVKTATHQPSIRIEKSWYF